MPSEPTSYNIEHFRRLSGSGITRVGACNLAEPALLLSCSCNDRFRVPRVSVTVCTW